jgi:N-acyl homoserine lactone hydrolase
MQLVVVEPSGRRSSAATWRLWHGELDEPQTEGQLRVRALDPELVWLAHEREPWRAHTVRGSTPARDALPPPDPPLTGD